MADRPSPDRRMRIAGYVLSGLVALFLLMDAGMKLPPLGVTVVATTALGYPAEVVRPLGITLLICTLLYIWPRTAMLGAVLITAYLGGAVATHVRIASPLFSHTLFGVYIGVMMWGGLWLRDARLRALFPLRAA